MIQVLWLTTGTLGIVMTMEREWDIEGLYLFLLALFFPWGFRGLLSLAVCILLFLSFLPILTYFVSRWSGRQSVDLRTCGKQVRSGEKIIKA